MQTKKREPTLFKFWNQAVSLPRNIKLFLVNVLAYGMAVEGISAVLLNLYLLRLGYGTEFIGTLNSAGLLVFALVSLPIGAVQRLSSRQMMQVGQVLSLAGIIGIPLAMYLPQSDNLQGSMLIFFRILGMIGLSAYFVHQLPFVMEITPVHWHNKAMSITMAVFSLSSFIGSWVGGMLPGLFGRLSSLPLTDPRPFQQPMLWAAIIIVPAMIAIWLIPERTKPLDSEFETESESETGVEAGGGGLGWRSIFGLVVVILLIRAVQVSGVGVIMTFSNVYLDEALQVPTGRIGFITGFGRLLGVPISLTIPWLMDRFGNFRLVHISLGLIVLLIVPLALIPFWPVAAIALIAINSMGSLRYLSFITFAMSLVSKKQRSLMSGVGEMAIGLGFSLSSFIGGYLIAWYGYREMFIYGAILTMIGAVTFWLVFRKRAAALAVKPLPAA